MADFIIKHIPAEKMKEFKTACAHFKESMRKTLIDMMEITISAYHVDMDRRRKKIVTLIKKEP